jgi:diketogulonate reductase-like aldo/keto reductase
MSEIPTVRIGDGIDMPIVGFGTWQLHGQQAYDAVRYAFDAGYRLIDTATMYKNEEQVGRALRDSGLDRGEVFLTTKLPPGNAGQVRRTLDESLGALGTNYVDLWLVHWPPRRAGASQRVWQEFLELRSAGLCRAVGVSNYSLAEIDELTRATGQTPAVNQVPWSPTEHDAGFFAGLRERGVAVEAYSSLKRTRLKNPVLAGIAGAHGVTPAQVVLRWHVQLGIIVIPKSARRDRIEANLDLFSFTLTSDEMDQLTKL